MHSYLGYCRTHLDCMVLFEAANSGLIPKRTMRLSEDERSCIDSGMVFVWDENAAGIKRWTDGKSWSTSRVSGPFLVYRELESIPTSDTTNGCRIKPYGLCKQSASFVTADNVKLHLIAYYRIKDLRQTNLMQPSMDPRFKTILPLIESHIAQESPGGSTQQAQLPPITQYGSRPMTSAIHDPIRISPVPIIPAPNNPMAPEFKTVFMPTSRRSSPVEIIQSLYNPPKSDDLSESEGVVAQPFAHISPTTSKPGVGSPTGFATSGENPTLPSPQWTARRSS